MKPKRTSRLFLVEVAAFAFGGALAGGFAACVQIIANAILFPNVMELYLLHPPSAINEISESSSQGCFLGSLFGALTGVVWPYSLARKGLRVLMVWTVAWVALSFFGIILSILNGESSDLTFVVRAVLVSIAPGIAFAAVLALAGSLLEIVVRVKRSHRQEPTE